MNDRLRDHFAHLFAKSRARIRPATEYYAITILSPEDGRTEWSLSTHWAGWVDGKPPHEIREGSIIHADRMADYWERMEELFVVVNTPPELGLFLRGGGHALVAKDIALEYLSDFVGPKPSVRDGPLGFKHLEDFPTTAFNRAPTPKHRMRVLKRDELRCRICGRRPSDDTDVQLHVHHIRPFGRGGLTVDENLITVCHTCHGGLQPHEDHDLFDLVDVAGRWKLGKRPKAYYEGVLRYRRDTEALLAGERGPRPSRRRRSRAV